MKSLPDILRRTAPSLMPKAASGAGASMGWGDLRLLLENWDTIVDPHYARLTSPVGVKFNGLERREGTLTLACPGPLGLELQHEATGIMERINRLFGYTAVARIQLVLPKLALPDIAPPTIRRNKIDPAMFDGIEDEELRERLAALGAVVGN